MLRIDTQLRSLADASPSNFFKQNKDVKTALRQPSSKKHLDKGLINWQDHGELQTLDLVSPQTDELPPNGAHEPRPFGEGVRRSPGTIYGSPNNAQFLFDVQSPAYRNLEGN